MTDTKTFHLPDLGEGLPDATIVEWFVKEGDTISIDVDKRELNLHVDAAEIERRKAGWTAPEPRYNSTSVSNP